MPKAENISFIRKSYEGGGFFLSKRMAYCGIPHAFYTKGKDGLNFRFLDSAKCHRALREVGLQDRSLQYAHLVHGTDCLDVSLELDSSFSKKVDADSLCSNNANQVLLVRTADCIPLLIASKNGLWVSAVHAGWRGFLSGVIENTLSYAPEKPSDLLFAIGPCIGANSRNFEVGETLSDAFVAKGLEEAIVYENGRFFINLSVACFMLLEQQGASQIDSLGYCTYENKDFFYSYRRDVTHLGSENTGQIGSVIGVLRNVRKSRGLK